MKPSMTPSHPNLRVAMIDDVGLMHTADAWAFDIARHNVEKLAVALSRLGHSVDIYRARLPGESVWEDVQSGVRIHRVADVAPWSLDDHTLLSQSAISFVERVQYLAGEIYPCDVVHAWGPFAGLVALRLTRKLNLPFVLNMNPLCPCAAFTDTPTHRLAEDLGGTHDDVDDTEEDIDDVAHRHHHWALQSIESLLTHRADHLIASSESEQDHLLNEHGPELSGLLHLIPPGVDAHTFKPGQKRQARLDLGLPPDDLVVLWGDLIEHPSLDDVDHGLIASCLCTVSKLPVHMAFVSSEPGQGTPFSPVLSNATALDLSASHLSSLEALRACYIAADVLVMPSCDFAQKSLDPREAMACGTPVIALGCGQSDDLANVVIDGMTGYVLYRQDPMLLLQHLRELVEQPHLRTSLGTASLLRARTFFTWDRMAGRLASIYADTQVKAPSKSAPNQRLTLVRSMPKRGGVAPFRA